MPDNNEALLLFAKTLSGHYSNLEQSQENPKDFAHINIFFRPLPWDVLKGPGFYSEQSYDHDPWRPYRQGVHRLLPADGADIWVKLSQAKTAWFHGMAVSPIWSAKWMSTPQTGSVVTVALTPKRMNNAGDQSTDPCGSSEWPTSVVSWTTTGSSGKGTTRLSS